MPDLLTFLIACVVFGGGGFLQSVIGFGFNILTVPSLTILTNARTAVTVVSIPSFATCVVLVWGLSRRKNKTGLDFKLLLPILITAGIGTLVGAMLLAWLDPHLALTALGSLLLIFVATARFRKNWQPNPAHATKLALTIGTATGILNGLAGVAGPTLVPYLHSLKLDKDNFVYSLNFLFIFLGIAQFISFGLVGFFTWERLLFGLSVTPFSLFGLYLGAKVRDKVSQEFFNRLVLIILLVTALDLLRRGLQLTF